MLNLSGLVPTLATPQGPLPQSLAVLERLDEVHPEPALLSADQWGRARVRSLAQIVALDIHPMNNLRILKYPETEFGADAEAKARRFRTWISAGMHALETRIANEPKTGFCHGDVVGLADFYLFAQVLNNARFGVDIALYPIVNRIHTNCTAAPELEKAAPANQSDGA